MNPAMSLLADCMTLQLPRVQDARGDLTFIESTFGNRKGHLPFEIRRVYYLYNVPGGSMRGGHAHLSLHQYAIAMHGSFDMVMDDGQHRKRFHLDSAHQALYIPPMVWHELENFSAGAVCLVLASDIYDEADYLRHYGDFLHALRERQAEARLPSANMGDMPGRGRALATERFKVDQHDRPDTGQPGHGLRSDAPHLDERLNA